MVMLGDYEKYGWPNHKGERIRKENKEYEDYLVLSCQMNISEASMMMKLWLMLRIFFQKTPSRLMIFIKSSRNDLIHLFGCRKVVWQFYVERSKISKRKKLANKNNGMRVPKFRFSLRNTKITSSIFLVQTWKTVKI